MTGTVRLLDRLAGKHELVAPRGEFEDAIRMGCKAAGCIVAAAALAAVTTTLSKRN